MTNESHETAAATQCAGHDTEGGVTSWSSTNATTTGTAGDSVSATVELMLLPTGTAISQIYQHIEGGAEPPADGNTPSGNSFKINTLMASGAGNCYVLDISYPNGATVTVSDNNGNTWPGSAAVHANAGASNMDSAIYVLPNINSGIATITVAFGASIVGFAYLSTEYFGVSTTQNAGTSVTANRATAGPTAACGSFTPTNNDSTGGNIIHSFHCVSNAGAPTTIPTNIRSGPSFTQLGGDIGWFTAASDGYAHGTQAFLQATHAAINPKMAMVGDTSTYNSLCVALKISAGTGTAPPTGIQLPRIAHFGTGTFPATGAYNLQVSTSGNCRVVACDDPNLNADTVWDSEGNSYTSSGGGHGNLVLPQRCSQFKSSDNRQRRWRGF